MDLWDLYSAVLDMGGSYRVNQQSQWDQVHARLFGSRPDLPVAEEDGCRSSRRSAIGVNVSVALRQIYQRYLMPYERVHYSNFSHDVADEDEDESRPNFNNNVTGGSGSGKDSAASFVIHSSLTQPHPPQKHAHHVDPLTRLFCALVSGLANEMEFGLRVVTMLANSRQIDAIADLKLVDVLLQCCSLSVCHCREADDPQSTRSSHSQSCSDQQPLSAKKCVCLSRFWSKKCKDESIAALLLEDLPPDSTSPVRDDHDEERDERTGEKVKRIADLIRTVTESIQEYQEAEEDSQPEVAPLPLVRFAGLLLSSDDSEFKALALEIISNINLIGSHSRDEECYATLVNFIVCHCISLVVQDNDMALVRRSIRTLAHVAATTADEPDSAFERFIDESLINRLIELLTCQQDVSLLTATLEFCWTISENRPKLLTKSSNRVTQLLKILINLLNCDVNTHFTPQALKHVRVCDTRNRSQGRVTVSQTASTQQQSAVSQQTVRLALQPAVSGSSSGNNLAIVSDSESFAISWLKGLFESSSRSQPISISEMYTDYIKTSCKNGRKNVVGAQSFSQIIGRTFPSATITSTHVEGLAARPHTPRKSQNQVQGQLTSPILKAHLCAPPKTSPTPTLSATSLTTVTASSQNCTPTTTTLIKSLLANKLRSNSQTNLLKAEAAGEAGSEQSKAASKTTAESINSHPVSTSTAVSHVVSNQSVLTSSPQSVLISTSSASGVGLPGQVPQQFLLVRTIIQPGVSQSGMRLILPASAVYTPQRPSAPQAVTVNGNGLAASPPAAGQSNDILLKAVLGSGIVGEAAQTSSVESPKNCVKSSPLLNVLLDKGKLPESSSSALSVTTSSVSQTQPHDRVYILTTGSPIKSVNHSDASALKNGSASEFPNTSAMTVKLKPSATVVNCHTDTVLTNGDISGSFQAEEKRSNAVPIADLSSIRDIQKAVDDAPKLISKRLAEESSRTPAKKSRTGELSDSGNAEASKAVTKITPVNGEIKIPPKVSPEKVSPDVNRTVTASTLLANPAILEYHCEWHECKRYSLPVSVVPFT